MHTKVKIPAGWTQARLAEASANNYYDAQGRLMCWNAQRGWVETHTAYAFIAYYRKRQIMLDRRMLSRDAIVAARMRGANVRETR